MGCQRCGIILISNRKKYCDRCRRILRYYYVKRWKEQNPKKDNESRSRSYYRNWNERRRKDNERARIRRRERKQEQLKAGEILAKIYAKWDSKK